MVKIEQATTVINVKGFDATLHREMKIQAAVEGITIRELIEKSVRQYLAKTKKKGR